MPVVPAMADAHEHLRPPEDQGSQAGDRLLVVATLLLHGLEVKVHSVRYVQCTPQLRCGPNRVDSILDYHSYTCVSHSQGVPHDAAVRTHLCSHTFLPAVREFKNLLCRQINYTFAKKSAVLCPACASSVGSGTVGLLMVYS